MAAPYLEAARYRACASRRACVRSRSRVRLMTSSGEAQAMPAQRQCPVAFPGGREQSVRDGRDEGDRADFAGAAHFFGTAIDDVYLDRRRLVDPWNLEVVKVRLDRTSVLKRNVRFEGRAESPYRASLDRVLADFGIKRNAAVDDAGDAMDIHLTSRD